MSFFAELKRRNVYRAAMFYAASGWLLVQVATQIFPLFHIAEWMLRWIVVAVVVGFPFALLFSWFYEWTPEGFKRDSAVEPSASITSATGKKLDRWIIAIMAVAIVLLLTDRLVLRKDGSDAGARSAPAMSIAVLPLANDSGDKDQQYFSDGLSEDLTTALAQFAGLKVIGRNSAFQFRDSKDDIRTIGAKLGVAHLLEGSVRRAGDVVRISAELVDTGDGSTQWSQRYDRPYKDLFALQDEIATAVATALKAKLLESGSAAAQSERPPSGNLDAYNAYLQGWFFYSRRTEADLRKATDQFEEAVRIDPGYAYAWATASRTWTTLASSFLEGEAAQAAYAKARSAADTALSLAPELATAHIAHGYVVQTADFDWRTAEAEFVRAAQLAPDNGTAKFGLGFLRATLGQLERAATLLGEALASDPLHASWYQAYAGVLCALGRLDEAEASIRKAIELQPGAVHFHQQLVVVAIVRGDAAGALRAARQEPPGPWQDAALALALQIGTDRAAADAALKNLVDKHAGGSAYQIAEVYALRNDADNMFAWLERAWTARDAGIPILLYDPLILRYKADPRFAAFCRKVGLPPPGESAAATSADTRAFAFVHNPDGDS